MCRVFARSLSQKEWIDVFVEQSKEKSKKKKPDEVDVSDNVVMGPYFNSCPNNHDVRSLSCCNLMRVRVKLNISRNSKHCWWVIVMNNNSGKYFAAEIVRNSNFISGSLLLQIFLLLQLSLLLIFLVAFSASNSAAISSASIESFPPPLLSSSTLPEISHQPHERFLFAHMFINSISSLKIEPW